MSKLINFLVLCIAVLGVWAFMYYSGCNSKLSNIEKANQLAKDSLVISKDYLGRIHAERLAIVADKNAMQQLYSSKIDSLKKAISGLKTKHIVSYTQTGITATNTIETQIVHDTLVDTVLGLPKGWEGDCFSFKDSVISLYGCILDSNAIRAEYFATLTVNNLIYWKRKKILGLRIGRPQFISNAWSDNPNVSINSLFTIKKK